MSFYMYQYAKGLQENTEANMWHKFVTVDLFLDYYCKTIESGGDYIGTIARTVSGRTCQRWEVQFPHKHEFGEELPGSAAAHRNYCRNPGNKMAGGPWCFTTDPSMEWEYCEIPMCRKYWEFFLLSKGGSALSICNLDCPFCIAYIADIFDRYNNLPSHSSRTI